MSDNSLDFLVIIPTHRRPKLVSEAVKSALAQTGVSKKIIVIDDCPDASAEAAVRGLGDDVIYLKNPEPTGGWPAKVRNYGFNSSIAMGIKADFVHFLDDDDLVPEGHYAFIKQSFAERPEIGVLFGVLNPFCTFSDEAPRRIQQERQLSAVRKWRAHTANIARFYHHIGARLGLPAVSQWFFRQHARFGQELFLCSGGLIRYRHVVELGGFNPNVRVTEDYEFYTRAIISFGVHFLDRITALYRVGTSESLWNPLGIEGAALLAQQKEVERILSERQARIRTEMNSAIKFYTLKIAFRVALLALNKMIMPILDKAGSRETAGAS